MLAEFLDSLFTDGHVTFRAAPPAEPPDRAAALRLLQSGFEAHALQIAGPPIAFDSRTALIAAEFVWRACWYLVHRDSPAGEIQERMRLPQPPSSPSMHLSADVTFRHLPQLHRRARALSKGDLLTALIARSLRTWPLAGASSDIDEAPEAPLDFGGHIGLEMLYAERFLLRPRELWKPAGRIAEYVDLMRRKTP